MTYSTEVIADGPAVYYPMQETSGTTAVDSSGNNRPGTYIGGAVVNDLTDPVAPAGLGKHVRLDGSDDYVKMDASNWFLPAGVGFTLEAWVYQRSWTGDYVTVFSLADVVNSDDTAWAKSGSNNVFYAYTGGPPPTGASFGVLWSTGAWHHVVLTVASNGALLYYLDGSALYSTTIGTPNNRASRRENYVGASAYTSVPKLAASLAHVAVYNKVLSAARISAHYNAGITVAPTGPYASAVLADTPLLYARLGGPDSTAIKVDSSGNNRTANTLVGSPTYQSASLLATDTEDKSCTIPAGTGLRWDFASWMNVSSITLEAWVKPSNIGAGQYPMIMERQPFGSGNFQFRISPTGKLEFVFWAGTGGPFTVTGATTMVNGTTYHVAAKYDASTGIGTVYLNGAADGSYTRSPAAFATNNIQLTLAHGFAGDGAQYAPVNFAGVIDEAAYYGTALSSARILAHYTAGIAAATNDLWVWDGTTEVPANVTVWNGTSEVEAGVSVT